MEILDRISIVQNLLDSRPADNTYVEIGISRGKCFLNINAKRKYGVDPLENSSVYRKFLLLRIVKAFPEWFRSRHYKMTSDLFFEKYADNLFAERKIDVAFIDGLHTYEQSLKDVHFCLKHLKDDGVIALHDCSPPHAAAAHPAQSLEDAMAMNLPGWDSVWNGDVWKTIVNLRSTTDNLKVFVLDCDWGVGIVTPGEPMGKLSFTVDQIDAMTFDDLSSDRENLLNLKKSEYLHEFLNDLK